MASRRPAGAGNAKGALGAPSAATAAADSAAAATAGLCAVVRGRCHCWSVLASNTQLAWTWRLPECVRLDLQVPVRSTRGRRRRRLGSPRRRPRRRRAHRACTSAKRVRWNPDCTTPCVTFSGAQVLRVPCCLCCLLRAAGLTGTSWQASMAAARSLRKRAWMPSARCRCRNILIHASQMIP